VYGLLCRMHSRRVSRLVDDVGMTQLCCNVLVLLDLVDVAVRDGYMDLCWSVE
jgi:hypothetical protein